MSAVTKLIDELTQKVADGHNPDAIRVALIEIRVEAEQMERDFAKLQKQYEEMEFLQRRQFIAKVTTPKEA